MNLIEDFILYGYFSLKNYLIYHHFRVFKDNKTSLFLSQAIAIGYTLLNRIMIDQYKQQLQLTTVKGSVDLPSFVFLFIISDLTISLILVTKSISLPSISRIWFELLRAVGLAVFFYLFLTFFWTKSLYAKFFSGNIINYQCFQSTLALDIAKHFFSYGRFPADLSQVTDQKVNPLNKSPLKIISTGNPLMFKVVDELGNEIVSATKDFIGISNFRQNPGDFLLYIEQRKNIYCH